MFSCSPAHASRSTTTSVSRRLSAFSRIVCRSFGPRGHMHFLGFAFSGGWAGRVVYEFASTSKRRMPTRLHSALSRSVLSFLLVVVVVVVVGPVHFCISQRMSSQDVEWQAVVDELQGCLDKSNNENKIRRERDRVACVLATLWALTRKRHATMQQWAKSLRVTP